MVTHPDATLDGSSPTRRDIEDEGKDAADDDNEDEEDILGFRYAILWLAILTVFISTLSDMLVDTIEPAAREAGVPR